MGVEEEQTNIGEKKEKSKQLKRKRVKREAAHIYIKIKVGIAFSKYNNTMYRFFC